MTGFATLGVKAHNQELFESEVTNFLSEIGITIYTNSCIGLSIPSGQQIKQPKRRLTENERIILEYALMP